MIVSFDLSNYTLRFYSKEITSVKVISKRMITIAVLAIHKIRNKAKFNR